MIHKLIRVLLIVLSLPVLLFTGVNRVDAQGISPAELITAVNQFRANYDLTPYQVDSTLMAIAQAHSEYQASINKRTHTRADGTGPESDGISSENIGGGYTVGVQTLINQWADYWHTFTLIGYTSGLVGAGVAAGSDGYLYYTLVVRNTGKTSGLPQAQTTPGMPQATILFGTATPFYTATPQQDGSILHLVSAGQTLWDIAISYDTTTVDLAAINYLDAENPVIYPGQQILIRPAYTVTPTGTITATPLPPTRTLRPSRTPLPSRAAHTLTPSSSLTPASLLPGNTLVTRGNLRSLGIIAAVFAVLGAATLIFGRLWRGKAK